MNNSFSLRRLDLNLLLTLDALLAENHVTRAAERLHLSQPSVSVQLGKLRELFGDPLLLPGPRGMRPTARAQQLRAPLRQALESLAQAVAPAAPFAPLQAAVTWRVAAFDYAETAILLPLLPRLRALAPGSRLAVLQAQPSRITAQAERGEIDLAFHTSDEAPEGLHRRPLFRERYLLAGRADHPRLRRRPTPEQFCRMEHLIVSPDGAGFHGPTDAALHAAGLQRRVVLSVPHFLFARSVLARTDLVAMLPSRLVSDTAGLRVVQAPVEVPGYEMAMLWHERVHRDPAHRWLREQVLATLGLEP
ncbi:LysR family transcriptional regulator [Variovorax soli]|uniref:DNA-binding transcriptional LysR family regulator n=1 Tax=Variovorax soli TaxID=376815 RepID=A0ABU1N8C7_9BURK|nr:LysR family transcriptional regulator [Variovorax soli]MDR6534689.1 DNA-binding transcriptional LysR family regulator [Variovorax soli]